MEFSLSSPGFRWVPKLQRAEWEGVQIFIERGARKLEFVNFCGKGLSERKLLRRWLLSSSPGISSQNNRSCGATWNVPDLWFALLRVAK